MSGQPCEACMKVYPRIGDVYGNEQSIAKVHHDLLARKEKEINSLHSELGIEKEKNKELARRFEKCVQEQDEWKARCYKIWPTASEDKTADDIIRRVEDSKISGENK
jgi:hypothetical protein